MSNHTEPVGRSREFDRCYGKYPPLNGHYYAKDVRVFYPADPAQLNLVSCPVFERGKCGIGYRLGELTIEEILQLQPCRRLNEPIPVVQEPRPQTYRRAIDDPNYVGSPFF